MLHQKVTGNFRKSVFHARWFITFVTPARESLQLGECGELVCLERMTQKHASVE
jgi:hypothetical protein